MPTFFYEYEILPEFREDAMTLKPLGGLQVYNHDMGVEIIVHGRWYTLGDGRGFGVFTAPDVKSVFSWFKNWVPMLKIASFPVVDDNQFRRIVLGKEPEYIVSYDGIADKPPPGESLYILKYKFYDGKREEGWEDQAMASEQDAKAWAGTCTSLGRWHNLAEGSGYILFSSPDEEALYKWMHDWGKGKGTSLAHSEIIPVCSDQEAGEVVHAKPDFAKKRDAALARRLRGF